MTDTLQAGAALCSVFDRVFVINLEDRTDRRDEIDVQLKRIGMGLDHPAVTLYAAQRPLRRGQFPSRGARGCFQSHLDVLRMAAAMPVERFLILEDDVDFTDHFGSRMRRMAGALQQMNWDMLYGFMPRGVPSPYLTGSDDMVMVSPDTEVQCSHFMGLSRQAAQQAVPYLQAIMGRAAGDPLGGAMHVDGAYSWFRYAHPDLVTLAVNPALARQRPSRSDIQDQRWFDRNKAIRPLAGWARRLKRVVA